MCLRDDLLSVINIIVMRLKRNEKTAAFAIFRRRDSRFLEKGAVEAGNVVVAYQIRDLKYAFLTLQKQIFGESDLAGGQILKRRAVKRIAENSAE